MAEGQFAVMIDKDTHKKIKMMSAEHSLSMGEIVRIAMLKVKIREIALKDKPSEAKKS